VAGGTTSGSRNRGGLGRKKDLPERGSDKRGDRAVRRAWGSSGQNRRPFLLRDGPSDVRLREGGAQALLLEGIEHRK